MKIVIIVFLLGIVVFAACKKEPVIDPQLVDVVYEVVTNFTDSTDSLETEYASFKRNENTFYTINQSWKIYAPDSITGKDTTSVRRITFGKTGLSTSFTGFSRTTNKWKLRIRSSTGKLLKEGLPEVYRTPVDTGFRVAIEALPE